MVTSQNNVHRSDRLVARITPEDKLLLTRAAALEGWRVVGASGMIAFYDRF